jgi:Ran GTPase-activating protein (RanGAP) involved in mRNA processing and transport
MTGANPPPKNQLTRTAKSHICGQGTVPEKTQNLGAKNRRTKKRTASKHKKNLDVLDFVPEDIWADILGHIEDDDADTLRSLSATHASLAATMATLKPTQHASVASEAALRVLTEEAASPPTSHLKSVLKTATTLSYNGLYDQVQGRNLAFLRNLPDRRRVDEPERFPNVDAAKWRALVQMMPKLRTIAFTDTSLSQRFVQEMLTGLAHHRIEHLTLAGCNLRVDALHSLMQAPQFAALSLDLANNDFSDHEGQDLVMGCRGDLEVLNLSQTCIDLEQLRIAGCGRLSVLDISGNEGGSEFVLNNDLSTLKALETLNLSNTDIRGELVSHLNIDQCTALRELNLSENHLRNEGAQALALPAANVLAELNVSKNRIGSEGLLALFAKPMPQLMAFNFSENNLSQFKSKSTPNGCSLAAWPKLSKLDLSDCKRITQKTVEALNLAAAKQLIYLNVSHNKLDDDALRAIPWHALPNLQEFEAERNAITRKGLLSCNIEACPSLRELVIRDNAMTRDELITALDHKRLKNIIYISGHNYGDFSDDTPETMAALARITAALPPEAQVDL